MLFFVIHELFPIVELSCDASNGITCNTMTRVEVVENLYHEATRHHYQCDK